MTLKSNAKAAAEGEKPRRQRSGRALAKKIALVTGGLVFGLVVAMGGWRTYRAKAPLRDVLPTFTEPGPGPRSPAREAFGMTLGRTSLADASALTKSVGLVCADTSMRALMKKGREDKRKEIAAAAARGEAPDAVSSASMVNRRSPKEANPQVRWSCENAHANAIVTLEGDAQRPRLAGEGRLLMVFDSPAHPLRHVSFERSFAAAATDNALSELNRARRSAEARFGRPSKCVPAGVDEPKELAWLSPVECEWNFADLRVRTTAIHYGARGIVVGEIVEIPWPVRSDVGGPPAPPTPKDAPATPPAALVRR